MADATPDPIEPDTSEEIATNESSESTERGRSLLRMVFAGILGVLLVGDVAMYSLYKAMESRVESQDRRMDRMNKMLTDSLTSHDNAEKIAGLETQVEGLVSAVGDLKQMVEDTHEAPAAPAPKE
jgi:cytochrome c-type biogenesis protein CcmH/NrfG